MAQVLNPTAKFKVFVWYSSAFLCQPRHIGKDPLGIAFDSANGNLYVTNEGDDSVLVISGQTNSVVGDPIVVGHFPYGITFNPSNGKICN